LGWFWLESSDKFFSILKLYFFSESYLRGFEVPLLVLFTSGLDGPQVETTLSRCQFKLIVICNEDHAKPIIEKDKEGEFASIIPVYSENHI
jgi:hypothetical protein